VNAFDVARLDELERYAVGEHGLTWRPIRRRFDVRAFGVNAYTAENAGDEVVEEHTESSGHEELYTVIRGRATFHIGDEELDAPAGTLVFLRDSKVRRGAQAEEPGTTVLALGAKRGEPFEQSAWEHWFVAYPMADGGDLDGAIEEIRTGIATRPDHPVLLYHLACLEGRAGREAAVEHARAALRGGEFLHAWARTDPDFEPFRNDPEVVRLLESSSNE
jgi:quercetin dioxygenase-like cupin family protein